MIKFLFIGISSVMLSCDSAKTTVEELQKEHPNAVEGSITTDYKNEGCAFLFVFSDDQGNKQLVRPIQLPDELKKDGLRLLIDFRPSRVSNEGCDLANPVIIEWYQVIE